jgi:hypothetical protein
MVRNQKADKGEAMKLTPVRVGDHVYFVYKHYKPKEISKRKEPEEKPRNPEDEYLPKKWKNVCLKK